MGKRILVADDSQTIQKAFAMVLGSEHTLVPARSMDEALSAARSGRPDLVIADAGLGSSSGYELCALLKAEPALRGVPVHILTSNHNPYDEARASRSGADGCIVKPFDSQALIDSVAAALATPARAVAAAAAGRPAAEPPFSRTVGEVPAADADDEDSYGEITIERGPAAPSPSPWSSRPLTRPSAGRPVVSSPAPAPAATPVPPTLVTRPSLIPGTRPTASTPVARAPAPGIVPAPAVPPPTTTSPVPRSMANRTMMGFPAVAGQVSPGAPIPHRPAIPTRTPVPPTAASSPPAVPAPRFPAPAAPRPPVVERPIAPAAPAPVVASAPVATFAAVASAPVASAATLPAVTAAVSSVVDSKMAAMAARGPEYEAIAKLSREIIEQVVWEVVPELAELIIKQEVDRLASAKR